MNTQDPYKLIHCELVNTGLAADRIFSRNEIHGRFAAANTQLIVTHICYWKKKHHRNVIITIMFIDITCYIARNERRARLLMALSGFRTLIILVKIFKYIFWVPQTEIFIKHHTRVTYIQRYECPNNDRLVTLWSRFVPASAPPLW